MKLLVSTLTLLLLTSAADAQLFCRGGNGSGGARGCRGGGGGNGGNGNRGSGGGNNGGGGNNNNNGSGGGNGSGDCSYPPTAPPEEGDWLVRFSKIDLAVDAPTNAPSLPLHANDYPVDGTLATTLQHYSNAVSVVSRLDAELDHTLCDNKLQDHVQAMGGPPTHPNNDMAHPFWDDFREVVEVQNKRRNGDSAASVLGAVPVIWEGYTIDDVAEAVHDEYPGHWQSKLLQRCWEQGAELDTAVLPFRSNVDFVGGPVRAAALNTWATDMVAAANFRVKWMYGRSRPEEVAWMIATNDPAVAGVPADIKKAIDAWDLPSAAAFTAYDEGSPRHPSWPAMHSAASSASLWMSVIYNLTPEQYCQALRTDYGVSYARTVAGVHYPTDNIAGLNLGQRIIADYLEDHLVDYYKADRLATRNKIASKLFDWNKFDPKTCTIAE